MSKKFERCPFCGEFDRKDTHVCNPIYLVWSEDDDVEDAVSVYARSPKEAAKNFVKGEFDDYEYLGETIVFVADNSGNRQKFSVTAEQTIVFSVSEVSDD
ncbi:MAG: hypothetical protein WC374_10600 [Phycisphaerae bacterium]